MESIDNKILNIMKKCGRGKVFLKQNFVHLSNPKRVQKALEQLTEKGLIIRVARGVYCYPKIDNFLNTGAMMPSVEEIAEAIAKRDGAKIVPTAAQAQNFLGLSTQVQMNFVFFTNGKSRKITLLNGRKLTFVHTALKNVQFKNRLAELITIALKDIGEKYIDDEQKAQIHKLLKQEEKENVMQDIAKMPDWIKNIVINAYD